MKKLKLQKRLSASVLKCSKKRISFHSDNLEDIKEAITKADIKNLVRKNIIKRKPIKGTSKSKSRPKKVQKKKGLQKGHGSRKGKANARLSDKRKWINKIRAQKRFLKKLRDGKLIDTKIYRELYLKSKGGYFRSVNHIKFYIDEGKLIKAK